MKSPACVAAALALAASSALAAVDIQPGSAGKYRKVLFSQPTVQFDRAFLDRVGGRTSLSERIRDEDAKRIAAEMGESFQAALQEAFRARGFEITTAPGDDVLQLAPAITRLYVNAPDTNTPGITQRYTREAGAATMAVEGRDSRGGRVLGASDHMTAGDTLELRRATAVSNRFWFDSMFRHWADDLAKAVASAR